MGFDLAYNAEDHNTMGFALPKQGYNKYFSLAYNAQG